MRIWYRLSFTGSLQQQLYYPYTKVKLKPFVWYLLSSQFPFVKNIFPIDHKFIMFPMTNIRDALISWSKPIGLLVNHIQAQMCSLIAAARPAQLYGTARYRWLSGKKEYPWQLPKYLLSHVASLVYCLEPWWLHTWGMFCEAFIPHEPLYEVSHNLYSLILDCIFPCKIASWGLRIICSHDVISSLNQQVSTLDKQIVWKGIIHIYSHKSIWEIV